MKITIFAKYPYKSINEGTPLFGGVPVWRKVKKIECETITKEHLVKIYEVMAQQISFKPHLFKTHAWQIGYKGFRVIDRTNLNEVLLEG